MTTFTAKLHISHAYSPLRSNLSDRISWTNERDVKCGGKRRKRGGKKRLKEKTARAWGVALCVFHIFVILFQRIIKNLVIWQDLRTYSCPSGGVLPRERRIIFVSWITCRRVSWRVASQLRRFLSPETQEAYIRVWPYTFYYFISYLDYFSKLLSHFFFFVSFKV